MSTLLVLKTILIQKESTMPEIPWKIVSAPEMTGKQQQKKKEKHWVEDINDNEMLERIHSDDKIQFMDWVLDLAFRGVTRQW